MSLSHHQHHTFCYQLRPSHSGVWGWINGEEEEKELIDFWLILKEKVENKKGILIIKKSRVGVVVDDDKL